MKKLAVYILLVIYCIVVVAQDNKEEVNEDRPICKEQFARYSNRTRRCQTGGIDGYETNACEKGQRFFVVDDVYGDCDCDFYHQYNADIIIYWPPTDTCYLSNTKGPCGNGQWLVLNDAWKGECQNSPCPDDGRKYVYWKPDGKCYLHNQQGPCEKDLVLRSNFKPYYDCNMIPAHATAGVGPIPCVPGLKFHITGKCKPNEDNICPATSSWSSSEKRCVNKTSNLPAETYPQNGRSPHPQKGKSALWHQFVKRSARENYRQLPTHNLCRGLSSWDSFLRRCVGTSSQETSSDERCQGISSWDAFLNRCVVEAIENPSTGELLCPDSSTWDSFLNQCIEDVV